MNEFNLPARTHVLAAAARMAAYASVTPVLRSRELDALTGARLFFKGEHLQRSGSFKFRGACNALGALDREHANKGVITHSSGNHGAALALAAHLRQIPCHVIVPEGAVAAKLANISRFGAKLWRCAPIQAAREAECARVQRLTGAHLVHPYADSHVIAGQGTAALELVHQAPVRLDALLVPVGGGGLAAGTRLALQYIQPECELILAEPAGACDTARSLANGQHDGDGVADTLCDGLRGTLGTPNFALLNGHARVIVVDDVATVAAQRMLWQVLKQVVEPSSAIVLAALLAQKQAFIGRNVGLILSGGNIDLDALPWGQR